MMKLLFGNKLFKLLFITEVLLIAGTVISAVGTRNTSDFSGFLVFYFLYPAVLVGLALVVLAAKVVKSNAIAIIAVVLTIVFLYGVLGFY